MDDYGKVFVQWLAVALIFSAIFVAIGYLGGHDMTDVGELIIALATLSFLGPAFIAFIICPALSFLADASSTPKPKREKIPVYKGEVLDETQDKALEVKPVSRFEGFERKIYPGNSKFSVGECTCGIAMRWGGISKQKLVNGVWKCTWCGGSCK